MTASEAMTDHRLLTLRHDGVLTITFHAPDRLNAITQATLAELIRLVREADVDPTVRVIVFTGNGRAFTAGQDLEELEAQLVGLDPGEQEAVMLAEVELFQEVTRTVLACATPTVAAINGVAVGFGAELSLICDIRIAGAAARIGFVEATRALFQTNGVMWLLPRTVGHGTATRMLLTGEIVSAERALAIGLVSEVVPDTDLPEATARLTSRLASNAPLSMRLAKDVLRHTWAEDLKVTMQREVDCSMVCFASEDLAEGTRAFHEKRPPQYQGR